jgi:hypothetical protein
MMADPTTIRLASFRRLPGLSRRWQFVEILRPGVHYQLENAGVMQDGRPLIEVFVCDPVNLEHAPGANALASSRLGPTVHAR